jgi:hypothetical protein
MCGRQSRKLAIFSPLPAAAMNARWIPISICAKGTLTNQVLFGGFARVARLCPEIKVRARLPANLQAEQEVLA